MDRRSLMKDVKILVIKVGTRVLATDAGTLDEERISALVREIAQICNNGIKVVLVSSGAITAGIGIIGLKNKPKTLPDKQAAAAVGQSRLMEVYNRVFDKSGMISAQILLTAEDLNERRRHLNARNTLVTLLSHGIVPVVNENDTVSVDEIRFGENDRLSALVAQLIQADLLLILSDVDGLMSADPTHGGESMLISCVESVDDSIRSMAGDASAHGAGTGGMRTKLEAAQIVTRAGETMVVANGRKDGVITAVLSGKDEGTLFLPKTGRLSGKKRWLAFFAKPSGKISIDKGAVEALQKRGKSLLSSGIFQVSGSFQSGDAVTIVDSKGKAIAQGLANYSAQEVEKIIGKKTCEIESMLGYKDYDEVIHRDNLVIL